MSVGSYCHGKFIHKIDPFDISKDYFKLMIMRGIYGTLAFLFQLISIYLMPISLAMVLYFTQPIFASVFGYLFNNEGLNCFDIFGIIFSLFGTSIICNPVFF